jgi:radical SAM-linked protein
VEQLSYETSLKKHPIAFSASIHDRAIVEIRRGCGRMCRFCQPGHVTLPVRERPAEEIIKITKELVHNTGYDEYSLLSLSSNDYSNIKEVIKELSCEFDEKKVGVSLPSQRIDGFNLELAELTQSVRKSTMTLAPEAGSQRLRNVIKKNISEEQIMNAVTALYENGWSRIKFYFIVGLPTETFEDMDEMASLMEKIRYRCRGIKAEKGLKHGLDVTCTLSIFVPKPFTPFEFCPQMDLDEVMAHVMYLKDKTKHIKGLKLNYHEPSVSQIEAVLTRGGEDLCEYIEKLYQNGCYLDAWGEYFNKELWHKVAEDCGIDIKTRALTGFSTEEELPWDFINIGIDKKWFVDEYKRAFEQGCEFNLQPTCEQKCVNCGVCPNLKVHKVLDKPYKAKNYVKKEHEYVDPRTAPTIKTFKYRLKVTKLGILRYFSHLDWQNTFLKSILRSGLKVAFTQGFNPTPKVSMGVALPLFLESDAELVDVELLNKISCEEFEQTLSKTLPQGCSIVEVKELETGSQAIDHVAQWAEYRISLIEKDVCNLKSFVYNCDMVLSREEILLTKKNKKGLLKTSNIKSSIKSYRFENEDLYLILKTGQGSDIPAVRADDIMKLISADMIFDIKRLRFFDENLIEL